MSTAITYLAQARRRPNLTIQPDTMVHSVECKGTRTAGIRLLYLDGTLIEAGNVVLAAGADASPAILTRSGLGPVEELQWLDIRPVLDLPGVGANLSDHALISIELPTQPSQSPSRFGIHATLHSTIADPNGPPDLMMFTAGPFDVDPEQVPGGAAFGIMVGLMAPRFRGWIGLPSNDQKDPPRIHFGHLTDPEDLNAMLDGITEARRIALNDPVAAIVTGAELTPGPETPRGDRQALASWTLGSVSTFHHPGGTCAMGAAPESGAVTDAHGSVHGIDGLIVADASIMPIVPTGTPNLPIITVAEHIARWLRNS
jgi:choline dehydrogenase